MFGNLYKFTQSHDNCYNWPGNIIIAIYIICSQWVRGVYVVHDHIKSNNKQN